MDGESPVAVKKMEMPRAKTDHQRTETFGSELLRLKFKPLV
jgi:hypothetical protein